MSEDLKDKDFESAQELTSFVKGILDQMNERFTNMTDNIVNRIEEITERINDLETTVTQLVEETNSINPMTGKQDSKGYLQNNSEK